MRQGSDTGQTSAPVTRNDDVPCSGRSRQLILIELNEVNFDIAQAYIGPPPLSSFSRMSAQGLRRSSSETSYEQLEPWIQWVSAHTGLAATEHGVFRLGDIAGSPVPQVFEQLEAAGLSVGAVSPMNAANRLDRPRYFLPDPWTRTGTDGSFWSRTLSACVSQAVNDNSNGRITLRSAFMLVLGLARFAQPRHYGLYARLAARSHSAPWRKALFLDLFLHDLHMALWRARSPDFSTLFLNAGAHIQHHYFFNSRAIAKPELKNPAWYIAPGEDPIREMLEVYDTILADYFRLDADLIVATGLTQQPYDRVKFYYRLRDHAAFLGLLGLRFKQVVPRMTRDFLVEFDSSDDALHAARLLGSLRLSGEDVPLFADIDNRGLSLFVTLTYPREIGPQAPSPVLRGLLT
jgi:hypothetical protein